MDISIEELVVWLLVGAFVGSVIGVLVKRKKEGFGRVLNLTVGLVGALIGGLLFKLFKVDMDLGEDFVIKKQELVAATIGAIILLIAVWIFRKGTSKKTIKE